MQAAAPRSEHSNKRHREHYEPCRVEVSFWLLVSIACFQQASYGSDLPNRLLTISLSALERTFLGHLRTSIGLSIVAIIISQLFRLEHNTTPSKTFGFFILGTPLACLCLGAAIVVLLLGANRFWRQQNAMLRGKVRAGGWEINAIGLTVFMVRCGLC